MSLKIVFATEPCGRCGGSGSYSYCHMYGTKCFGCGGSGKAPTKVAAKGRKLFDEWCAIHLAVSVRDIQPGMIVRYRKGDGYRRVEGVTPNHFNAELFNVQLRGLGVHGLAPDFTFQRRLTVDNLRTVFPLLPAGAAELVEVPAAEVAK